MRALGTVKGSPFPCAFLESNRVSVLHYLMRTDCNWELNDSFLLALLYAPTYSQLEKTITAIFLLLRKTIKTSEKKNLSIESINTYNSVENTLKQIQSLTNQTAISFLYFVFPPSFPRSKAACFFFFFYSFKVISAKRFFFSGEVEEIPFAVKHHLSPDKNNNNF